MSKIRFVGLDVHAETIAVAVAETGGGELRSLGTIPNKPESVRKLVGTLAPAATLKCCYEAGPTGYVLGLATHATGRGVRSHRSKPGPDQSGGPGENRPSRCGEVGAVLPRG